VAADRFRFAWLEAVFSERGPSSHTERSILAVIFCYVHKERLTAWPNQRTIAARARISVRQAKRLLAKLETDGWFRTELSKHPGKRGWRKTVYQPMMPSSFQDEQGDIDVSPCSGPNKVTSSVEQGDISASNKVTSTCARASNHESGIMNENIAQKALSAEEQRNCAEAKQRVRNRIASVARRLRSD
jgi:hypothetical protein